MLGAKRALVANATGASAQILLEHFPGFRIDDRPNIRVQLTGVAEHEFAGDRVREGV